MTAFAKRAKQIDEERCAAVSRALLKQIPRSKAGVRFIDLFDTLGATLPESADEPSLSAYLTMAKLDLEAQGLIERVPDSVPQRLRRTTRARRS